MTNADLATLAVRLGRQHLPRTPGRRAAGMVYAALITTRTPDAARRALGTFGESAHRAAAVRLLDELRHEADRDQPATGPAPSARSGSECRN